MFESSAVRKGSLTAADREQTHSADGPDTSLPGHEETPICLAELGWGLPFEADFEARRAPGQVPGRVVRVDRGALSVLTETGELRVLVAPEIAHERAPSRGPTVGDWVVLEAGSVTRVLPRKSAIVRGSAGVGDKPQVLAANMDKVFVVCSLEGRFRARRLERLVVLAWQSGAAPVAVLTKTDLAEDTKGALAAAQALIGGGEVLAVSSLTGEGMDKVKDQLSPGVTIVLLGPSGAGKSTLANRLGLGTVQLETGEVRQDGRGRHTTTARELVRLPGGAMLIDTPGLRALSLYEADEAIKEAFGDLEELAATCRFSDCRHQSEPGCAVKEAIESGILDADRHASFEKLRGEQFHLASRADPRVRTEQRKQNKALGKLARQSQKRSAK